MNRYKKFYMNLLGIKYKKATGCGDYTYSSNLCSTVALSKATGVKFDDMYDMQVKYGKENHVLMNASRTVIDTILKEYGYQKYTKVEVPSTMTVGEFMYNHKEGKYVILTGSHMEFYMNGTRYLEPINISQIIDLDSWLFEKIAIVWYK